MLEGKWRPFRHVGSAPDPEGVTALLACMFSPRPTKPATRLVGRLGQRHLQIGSICGYITGPRDASNKRRVIA